MRSAPPLHVALLGTGIVLFVLLCASAIGGAQPALVRLKLSPEMRVAVARVVANENSRPLRSIDDGGTAGVPTEDSYAIMQTIDAWARWQRTTHAKAIRALSPRITGRKPPASARQAANAELPAIGKAQPRFWLPLEMGVWSVYADNWTKLRAAIAKAAVDGFVPPCPGDPIAWGGDMDDHIAESRKLVRLACGDRNHFWALPKRVVDATEIAQAMKAAQ